MQENHYGKALFSSREGHFSLHWIRGILAVTTKLYAVAAHTSSYSVRIS